MKTYSTLLLRICIGLILLGITTIAFIGLVSLIKSPVNDPYKYILYPIIIGLYLSLVPFIFALVQAYRMLNFIDKKIAFSMLSIKALLNIKYAAFVFSFIYVALIPFLYALAQKDDAPGIILMGMVPVFGAFVIGVFAAVLQSILADAIKIKSENDLTV